MQILIQLKAVTVDFAGCLQSGWAQGATPPSLSPIPAVDPQDAQPEAFPRKRQN